MISGNMDSILSPIRTINGRVEVVDTSTLATKGEAVRLEGCKVGSPLEVQLSSRNLVDITKAHNNSSGTKIEIYDDYIIATGKASTNPSATGTAAWSAGTVDLPLLQPTEIGQNIAISFDIEYLEQMAEFSFPQSIVANFGQGFNAGSLTALGKYHIEKKLTTKSIVSKLIIYTQSCKVKISNIYVGEGTDATYTPYIADDDFADVELYRYGKNLFDYTQITFTDEYVAIGTGNISESTGYSCTGFIPCAHLVGQTITLNHPPVETGGGNPGMGFYSDTFGSWDASGVWLGNGGAGNGYTAVVPEGAKYFRFSVPRKYADGTQIQIELGDTVTEYESYVEPEVFTPMPDGSVTGLTALPTNTIFAYPRGMVVTAQYAVYATKDTYTNRDKLKSIQIDRVGENKFFGFGISQKATIVIVDKDCACGLAKGDRVIVYFNDVLTSPVFYISEVKRDEVTNDLTVTAYDALEGAVAHTVGELSLESYSIKMLATACANALGLVAVYPSIEAFSLNYETGANFEGSETIREVLNAIAEATQTIYYVNRNDELVFARLDKDGAAVLNIDKSQYMSLENKSNVVLTDICSITELGDNLEATNGEGGEAQNIYDNPLLELREDLPQILENAIAAVGGTDIHQYNLTWRGNYFLEPCDKITILTKMNEIITTYLITDTITYDGGYRQVSKWEYEPQEKGNTNPTTLGETLKQTYAKVDKANKTIELVASETSSITESIAQLQLDTGSINASVSNVESALKDATNTINGELATINEKVSATMTSEEIRYEISTALDNGVGSVQTGKGFTFNDEGLTIEDLENPGIITQITNNGMGVYTGSISEDSRVLTANDKGVNAKDLHANTYLIIGDYSRFENYGDKPRTACFWIG
jgi:hypothetical protein